MRFLRSRALMLLPLCLLGWAAPLFGDFAERPPLLLSFAGDLMHHRRNRDMPDYDRLYDSVRTMLLRDDLSFVNVEFPVDPAQPADGYPIFNGSIAYMEAAIRAGFDVFALANNHTYDLRLAGVVATARVFGELAETYPIRSNGIRVAPAAEIELDVILVNGWTIGFASITAFSNERGSGPHIHLVPYFEQEARDGFLSLVRRWSGEVDVLVVSIHAGIEYVTEPEERKARFFRDIADAGATIVWGHHPHVLQPWEMRGESLIIHSAGNFISAQRRHQNPFSVGGRWAPTGDTTIYRVRLDWDDSAPAVTALATPALTMLDHPTDGLVLRTFGEVLARDDLSGSWRRFYEERERVMDAFLGPGLTRM